MATRWLGDAERLLAAAPSTPTMQKEAEALAEIQDLFAEGSVSACSKMAKYQAYQRSRSWTYPNLEASDRRGL